MPRPDDLPGSPPDIERNHDRDFSWTVLPPGIGEAVVSQEVPTAAVPGLTIGADEANQTAGRGFNCWIVAPIDGADPFVV